LLREQVRESLSGNWQTIPTCGDVGDKGGGKSGGPYWKKKRRVTDKGWWKAKTWGTNREDYQGREVLNRGGGGWSLEILEECITGDGGGTGTTKGEKNF